MNQSEPKKNLDLETDINDGKSPKDKYLIVYISFFVLGVVHVLPWSFFVTANAYWMYKFRNITLDEINSETRTELQASFAPSFSATLQSSTVLFLNLSLFFGYRFKLKLRTFGTLTIMLIFLIITIVFTQIDTDSWQIEFFVLTMLIVAGTTSTNAILGMALYSTMAMLPDKYLTAYLDGQGVSRAVSSTLEIISLATQLSTLNSAIVYFSMGTFITASGLFFLLVINRHKFYQYHVANYKKSQERTMISFVQAKTILRKIWPSIVCIFLWELTNHAVHPNITSLVVSEGEGDGEWNDVYFVPCSTFLMYAVVSGVGRVMAGTFRNHISMFWMPIFSLVRMIVFIPLVMLCNAHPRHNLPVVFNHDYQYILINIFFSFTDGYLINTTNYMIPLLVLPEELENSYHVYVIVLGIFSAIFSYTAFVFVKLL